MTSLKTSIKNITYLSDIGCLEIQGASSLSYEKLCDEVSMFMLAFYFALYFLLYHLLFQTAFFF